MARDTLSPFVLHAEPAATVAARVRERLLQRVAQAREVSAAMVTAHARHVPPQPLAPGVEAATVYEAPAGAPLRRGEPARVRLLTLQPDARWTGPEGGRACEWLVLDGTLHIGALALARLDLHRAPPGPASRLCAGAAGARVYLRESATADPTATAACTARAAAAAWEVYAPGVLRRVLWRADGQGAFLYRAEPGTAVPHHRHGHDEECLMLEGELFLDDRLLRAGDYQLAPAGSGHRAIETDTGALIYARGDADMQFVA